MAKRPVFCPEASPPYVSARLMQFEWHAGMSVAQKRRSVAALHQSARDQGVSPILEVSTRSTEQLGVELSAFNLQIPVTSRRSSVSVECAFQGSKVFRDRGPFLDLFDGSSGEAKRDPRLQSSGPLIGFRLVDEDWPLEPPTAFYDWLYFQALHKRPDLVEGIAGYRGFTDIEFNPEKSISCQARSVALYVALQNNGLVERALASQSDFLTIGQAVASPDSTPLSYRQGSLF